MSRIGLGCMRLSTDEDRDESRALATIATALGAGTRWLDTAHAYGRNAAELGHNERIVARALAERGHGGDEVRVVTKCGMARPDGRWEPDGRASTILEHARASMSFLGRPPDVLLLHAPDPGVSLSTSVRALVRAREQGLARAIGLSNVTRAHLDVLPPSIELVAIEVALGARDDAAARGGVLAWCKERRVTVLAHTPLGGVANVGRIERDQVLRAIAKRHSVLGDVTPSVTVTPQMVVLAYLLAVDSAIVPIVGARRPETARTAMAAERLSLDERDLEELDARFPGLAMTRRPKRAPSPSPSTAEVVLVMGLAGSGKTRLAESYVARGYERLNRDTLGGTLDGIAKRLGELLAGGATRLVLDNTYVSRASRSEVVRVAHAAGAYVRCVHVETPAREAQLNLAWRMLERHGELLGGAELTKRAKLDAGLFAPGTLYRMERQLERPSSEEGFSSIEVVPFVREHTGGAPAMAMPIEVVLGERVVDGAKDPCVRPEAHATLSRLPASWPLLLFGWIPGASDEWRARALSLVTEISLGRRVEIGLCTHAGGPPVCWCRPPLPGLWLAFARRHGIDPRVSRLFAVTPTHRNMSGSLGIPLLES